MNCPQCEQGVGCDAIHVGHWQPINDERGIAQQAVRSVLIDCAHCGRFDVTQDAANNIVDVIGPLADPVSVERFARLVPSARREVRIPA